MKEGWEYKKLGEVCNLTMGQSPSSESYNKNGDGLPFFQGCSDFGVIHPQVTTYCNAPNKIANSNDILMSVRAPIGTLNIANVKCCIGRGLAAFTAVKGVSIFKFIYYFLLSSQKDLQSKGTGATFKAIGKELIKNYPIHLPPLSMQQHIVEELDLLSIIIEKKKAQLNELDNLLQSLFYEMFGDPITNDKGWEKIKLENLFKVTSSKRILQSEWQEDGIPFYKVADIVGLINAEKISPSAFIKESTYDELLEQGLVPCSGDILITSRGTLGQCYIVSGTDNFYFQDGMITWLSQRKDNVLPIYVKCLFGTKSFLDSLLHTANMSTVAYLSISQLSKVRIPLPPLVLQQQFSSKIEAIEHQKELIKQSIKEVETLFNSRMDYYFS